VTSGRNAGGEGVECAEMADGALLQNARMRLTTVVGGPSGGLVDDDDAIHGGIW